MYWEEVPETIDRWALSCAAPADDVRKGAVSVYTATPVGYYHNPVLDKVAVCGIGAVPVDLARCRAAASRAVGASLVIKDSASLNLRDGWVKVAYSPVVRRAGELLNFFPGQYVGGVPNHPSPLAAMLTSGLIGAGLGWGTGRLLSGLLPGRFGPHLGRTGLLLGGALGVSPGVAWGLTNKLIGRRFNDPVLTAGQPGDEPELFPRFASGANAAPSSAGVGDDLLTGARRYFESVNRGAPNFKKSEDAWVPLGAMITNALSLFSHSLSKCADAVFGVPDAVSGTPLDVNVNALGQTLWQSGASPALAGTTMGAAYAAMQMPDARARLGVVTPNQWGHLAASAGGDYVKGLLVGAALNAVVGTPYRATSYGLGAAALGLIGAIVPKLFGG